MTATEHERGTVNQDPYERLGVARVINAQGAVTYLGGLPMAAPVREAMAAASAVKVDLHEVADAVGRRIAELVGAEAAMVTTGAAGGWQLAAAACLAGDDRSAIAQLPFVGDRPREIVIHRKHRGNFDHALRSAGAVLRELGYSRDRTEEWEMVAALTPRPAAAAYVTDYGDPSVLPLQRFTELAHDAGVPVIVDAALSLPPVDNLRDIPGTGADLTSFSGGKAIGGPQNSGFLVGRADLIAQCRANTNPNHNTVGRALKVAAETMMGLLTAVELYVTRDHEAEARDWLASLELVRDAVLPHAPSATIESPPRPPSIPKLVIAGLPDPAAVADRLAAGSPSIRVGLGQGSVTICPHAVDPEDIPLLAQRLVDALSGRTT